MALQHAYRVSYRDDLRSAWPILPQTYPSLLEAAQAALARPCVGARFRIAEEGRGDDEFMEVHSGDQVAAWGEGFDNPRFAH